MFRILVVDDDKNTRFLFKTILEKASYTVFTAKDGEEALSVMEREHVDLAVLDVMMPRMDGYEFTKALRNANNNLPILMVSAKQMPKDKHLGFDAGTDDYMTKPIEREEFLYRIKALLRRAKIAADRRIVIGEVTVDYDAMTVRRGEEVVELPQKEFMLLFKLLSYPNKIYTRRQLMDEIWDMDSESDERTVDVHISRVRDRFRGSEDFEIVTVRGLGYKAILHK